MHRDVPAYRTVSQGRTGIGIRPVDKRVGTMAELEQNTPRYAIPAPQVHPGAGHGHLPGIRHLPGLTTSYAKSSALTGYHQLGPLYDGDAVHTDGRRPERISPAAAIHKTGFEMALGTHHATLAGDTLPMDQQVHSRTQQVYQHPGVGTQEGIDEGDRIPAGIGRRGAGRGRQVPTGMHF